MAALVLTLGEGVERFRLTPEGARGFTVEGLRAIWKVRCAARCPHGAATACRPWLVPRSGMPLGDAAWFVYMYSSPVYIACRRVVKPRHPGCFPLRPGHEASLPPWLWQRCLRHKVLFLYFHDTCAVASALRCKILAVYMVSGAVCRLRRSW